MLNFTDFLWSYKFSVSVQIYRDCNLQRKCGHLTEILPTFLKSVNGSSFPVAVRASCRMSGSFQLLLRGMLSFLEDCKITQYAHFLLTCGLSSWPQLFFQSPVLQLSTRRHLFHSEGIVLLRLFPWNDQRLRERCLVDSC